MALNLPGKFADAEKNESSSFLPGDAESTKALEATERLQGGETAPIVAVYRREGGLTAADRTTIAGAIDAFNSKRAELAAGPDPLAAGPFKRTVDLGKPVFSPDGAGAIATADITGNGEPETILDPVDEARAIISDPGGGLEAKVTGPAGFSADAIKVFEGINGTLLLAAGGLVFLLLILIYRSPLFFWIPLFAVIFAELADPRRRLRADRGRRDGQRPVVVDPLGARARRRHRLRAAARLALSRGAANSTRTSTRRCSSALRDGRPGDPRLRPDRDRSRCCA